MQERTLADAVELFLAAKSAKRLSEKTLRWYKDHLALLVAWCGEGTLLADVSAVDVVEWLDEERGKELAANSLDARWRSAQVFFNWCEVFFERAGYVSPMGHGRRRQVERPQRGRPVIDYVTQAEMRKLLDSIRGGGWQECRDRAIVRMLYWSGLRLAECAALDVPDLMLREGHVLVRNGKGNKARVVPIASELGPDVLGYLYGRPPWAGPELWIADGVDHASIKGRFTAGGIRQMLRRRCERASLRVMSPHEFRHGFAMCFLNKGLGISALSELMGHASVETTTRIYAHWLSEPLKEQYELVYAKATKHGR